MAGAGEPPASREEARDVLASYPKPVAERLMREKIVMIDQQGERNGDGMLRALVIFEQPRSRTLQLLSQTARQTEYRPALERVETVARDGGVVTDEHRMKIMFVEMKYRVRTHFDYERARISWRLDPDFENDVREIEGYWELYELDENRTLGRFGSKVDVGPAVPTWLQNYVTRRNVPQTADRMRRWVDSDGTYRP